VITAVGLEDPLDDLLAAFVLEVDVDVGRLPSLLGDEALEQKVVALGIDRRDPEDVADRGIGRRAASLTQCRTRLILARARFDFGISFR
jgi:hypothetical protein